METGIALADTLLAARTSGADASTVCTHYQERIDTLRPRFALYEKANRVNRHPWLADLVIRQAQGSDGLRRRMSGVLNETANPGHLLSVRGLFKLFTV